MSTITSPARSQTSDMRTCGPGLAPGGASIFQPRTLNRHLLRNALWLGCVLGLCAGLRIRAADTTELRVGKLRVGKVLFLGNSITLHGPAPAIGWTGNWGMAASAEDKDYVHLLTNQLAKAAGGRPEIKIKNIATFERQLTDYKLADELKEELEFEPDLIIVALGENASSLKTDEAKTQFVTAFTNLFTELKKRGQPTIIVRSQFWQDSDKDGLMKQTCDAAGGTFLDISKLGQDKANYARAERTIEHPGVAGHPGDQGMQALADALWEAIQKRAEASE